MHLVTKISQHSGKSKAYSKDIAIIRDMIRNTPYHNNIQNLLPSVER